MSIKRKLANIVGGTFIPGLFNNFFKGTKIVFYHGVIDNSIIDPIIQANQMPFENFKRQIEFMRKRFEIISLGEFEKRFNSNNLSGKEVIITFDDGYQNNLTIVAPYLKSLGVPFTVFICPELSEKSLRVPTYYIRSSIYSGLLDSINIPSISKRYIIGTSQEKDLVNNELIKIIKTSSKEIVDNVLKDVRDNFTKEQRISLDKKFDSEGLMDWDEIISLKKNYDCEIGSHCLDHTILHENQNQIMINKQLEESKKAIEAKLGEECKYFAFPNGDKESVCSFSIKSVREIYNLGFAVNGSNVKEREDKGYISRLSLAPDFNAFKAQLLILSNLKL